MQSIRRVCLCLLMTASVSQGFTVAPSVSSALSKSTTVLSAQQQSDNDEMSSRRQVLNSAFMMAASMALAGGTPAANALDMDAFVNSQIESDTKNCDPKRDPKCLPKMSADEALCKYGQSGKARGEACKRFKATGGTVDKAPQGKSLGGAYAM